MSENMIHIPLKILGILLLIFAPAGSFAQESLDDYVRLGLDNNIALKQKNIPVEHAELALKTAQSFFLPSVSLKMDYTSGEGGRAISIPVGDMLNPVYNTLNALTNSNSFPHINNVKEDFLPFQFYDAKLRVTVPLLNTDLIYNRNIQEVVKEIKDQDYQRYRLDLKRDIKIAYYRYLAAIAVLQVNEESKTSAVEAIRVNRSLLDKGSGLLVYVLRAESELEALNTKLIEAAADRKAATQYFNFLLNRPLDMEIKVFEIVAGNSEDTVTNSTTGLRVELQQIKNVEKIHELTLAMHKYQWLPKINMFFDIGAQDKLKTFNNSSKYYLFGFTLETPLFEAFRGSYRQEEAILNIKDQKLTLEDVTRKLEMLKSLNKDKVTSALSSLKSAGKQLKTAQAYQTLIDKGYKEGLNTFIETVDARAQFRQASELERICRYRLLIAQAEFERETSYIN
ncbi:MAG: TolC family protein [Ignavibacteriales bacterium]|nr:TolC family protein [Ignavibacteriales bacterium]